LINRPSTWSPSRSIHLVAPCKNSCRSTAKVIDVDHTSAEWAELLRELERSGQSPATFARSRGIRPDTLKWWRWRLGRKIKSGKPRPATSRVKLLAVEPARELDARDRSIATPVWELVAPSGHELRVYDPRGLGVLKAALFAVARGRRR
jgi:hypothetical protein